MRHPTPSFLGGFLPANRAPQLAFRDILRGPNESATPISPVIAFLQLALGAFGLQAPPLVVDGAALSDQSLTDTGWDLEAHTTNRASAR